MSLCARIVGTSPVSLWGLDATERIARQLRAAGVPLVTGDDATAPPGANVLLIDARYLFEVRTIAGLARRPGSALVCESDGAIAALHLATDPASADAAAQLGRPPAPDGVLETLRPAELEGFDRDLRRTEPPLLEPVTAANRQALEDLLYGNAYKGITDLVTKWLWPRPAKHVVRACATLGISPNAVTLLGLALVVAASFAFLYGHFAAGLACGWFMTLLDTVDGKLARVTVNSSRLGHVLDHGMDIVHPPFWYVMWGMGLATWTPVLGFERDALYVAIVAGYAGGRIIEGLFHALGHCSMFAWRPLDAYFRLVTARRNPCLILLSAAVLAGRPDLGFVAVTLWTVLSTALMALRLVQASFVRLTSGPLDSWLRDPAAATRYPAAFRTFAGTRAAYG